MRGAIDPLHGRVELAAAAIVAGRFPCPQYSAESRLFVGFFSSSNLLDCAISGFPDAWTALLAVGGLARALLGIPCRSPYPGARSVGGACPPRFAIFACATAWGWRRGIPNCSARRPVVGGSRWRRCRRWRLPGFAVSLRRELSSNAPLPFVRLNRGDGLRQLVGLPVAWRVGLVWVAGGGFCWETGRRAPMARPFGPSLIEVSRRAAGGEDRQRAPGVRLFEGRCGGGREPRRPGSR